MPQSTPTAPCLTPEDLGRNLTADLTACVAATPGPWRVRDGRDGRVSTVVEEGERPHRTVCRTGQNNRTSSSRRVAAEDSDAAFIAAARDGWPAAIRRALAAEAELERFRAAAASVDGPLVDRLPVAL